MMKLVVRVATETVSAGARANSRAVGTRKRNTSMLPVHPVSTEPRFRGLIRTQTIGKRPGGSPRYRVAAARAFEDGAVHWRMGVVAVALCDARICYACHVRDVQRHEPPCLRGVFGP